jgi:hypothetical protein
MRATASSACAYVSERAICLTRTPRAGAATVGHGDDETGLVEGEPRAAGHFVAASDDERIGVEVLGSGRRPIEIFVSIRRRDEGVARMFALP